jgi:hypothetical protein
MRGAGALPLLIVLATVPAAAQRKPWVDAGSVPLSSRAHSVEVVRHNEQLFSQPDSRSARRGTAIQGAHLPLFGATHGPGCAGRWLSVGPTAWVCSAHVRLSPAPALAPRTAPPRFADGLPYHYYFVGPDGSLGYAELAGAEEGAPDAELQPGFALAVIRVANKAPGDPFGLTTHGLWVPMRDLGAARPSLFHGSELSGGLDLGWVVADSAPVYEKPGGRRLPHAVRTQFEKVTVLETVTRHHHRWFRVGEGQWMSDGELRVPTPAPLPVHLRPGERWIDVDTDAQILTAYEGGKPVFATLVSTGKGREGSELATPKGAFHIWVKLRSTDMDNLENEEASRYYAIEDVPWVMFFKKGYGLHGTFWHHSFGHVRSHGCVNLTPLDAERLFYWAGPRLPAGWSAVLPTRHDPGTLVRVR